MGKEAPGYIGPYRLVNLAHRGPAIEIWQAYQDSQNRWVAVKTPLEKLRRHREHIGSLQWEYTVAHKLVHPGIVRMYEFEIVRGIPYLAMEWVSAPHMKMRIRQGTAQLAPLIPKIIQQAGEALACLNEAGWVHRDIKPENFLVADDGTVKMIDFALARRARRGIARLFARKTKIQGTCSYMAPEQIRGSAADPRADVYGFGCVVFELVAGRPPFTGANATDLLNKHLRTPPPAIAMLEKNVTHEFSRLLRRTMAKDPTQRPATVADFLAELNTIRVFRVTPPPPEPSKPSVGEDSE